MAKIPTVKRENNNVIIECQDEELACMIETQMKSLLSNRMAMIAMNKVGKRFK